MVRRPARLAALAAVALLAPMVATAGASPGVAATGDDTPVLLTPKGEIAEEFTEVDEAATSPSCATPTTRRRLLAGDEPLTVEQAAKLRRKGINRPRPTRRARSTAAAPTRRRRVDQHRARTRPCRSAGPPTPSRPCPAGSARWPSATTARSSSARPRAASGPTTRRPAPGPRAPTTPTPSRSARWPSPRATTTIVYMGSGEGALSGDCYYGDGVYKSTDGGADLDARLRHRSSGQVDLGHRRRPDERRTTSTSRPSAAAAASAARRPRPRAVRRSGSPPTAAPAGRCSRAPPTSSHGATDLVDGPAEPATILWASFWGDGDLPVHRRRRDLGQRAWATCRRATSSSRRHPLLARHLAPGRGSERDALHRLRLLRQRPTTTTPARGLQDRRRRRARGADCRPAARQRARQRRRLLRHAVLLRQRGQARPDQPEHRLRRSAPTATTIARSPAASTARTDGGADLEEPRATTCTPTSTPSPSSRTTPSTS